MVVDMSEQGSSNEKLTAVAIDRNGYRHDWAEPCVTENTGCERYYRADEVDKELERLRAENQALRNLAENLKPGPISEAFGNKPHAHETLLQPSGHVELVREIAERHDRVSKLLWGPGAPPGMILGPMDSDRAHADRGALLSLLTPEQRGELKANEEVYTQEALDSAHERTRQRLAKLKVDDGSAENGNPQA